MARPLARSITFTCHTIGEQCGPLATSTPSRFETSHDPLRRLAIAGNFAPETSAGPSSQNPKAAWIPERTLRLEGAPSQRIDLEALPVAWARVVVASWTKEPVDLSVALVSHAPQVAPEAEPFAEAHCLPQTSGYLCRLPAGRWDLRFQSSDSTPLNRFSIRGLQPGSTWISATARAASSDRLSITIREPSEHRRIGLEIHEPTTRRGKVLADAGPVAGADIVLWPDLTTRSGGQVQRFASDREGRFEADVESWGTQVFGLVPAPGFGTEIFRLELGAGQREATL